MIFTTEPKLASPKKPTQLQDGEGSRSTHVGRRVLIVDDELAQRKVLSVMLDSSGMACQVVSSAAEALAALEREPVDAIVADLNMPGMSGLQLLTEVRSRHGDLAFLMVTGLEDVRSGVEAMRRGADDYLIKPLQIETVTASLDRTFLKKSLERELDHYRHNLEAMVSERTSQLQSALTRIEQNYADTLDALGAAIDLRDQQTAGHSRRVALYSFHLLTSMHGSPEQLKNLLMGAMLHDIGKLAIPDMILLKPGPLTPSEREIMQTHSEIGYDLIKRIPFLIEAAEIILAHHERWDGTGHPRGLKATEIPINARIFATADSLDAMTSDRPYRAALSFESARDEIRRGSKRQFDPEIVNAFLSVPVKTWATLREQASHDQIGATLASIDARRNQKTTGDRA